MPNLMTMVVLLLALLCAVSVVVLIVRLLKVPADSSQVPPDEVDPPRIMRQRLTRGRVGVELISVLVLLAILRVSAVSLLLQVTWLVLLGLTAAVLWLAVYRWPALPARAAAAGNG